MQRRVGAGAAEQQQVGLEDAVVAGLVVGRHHRVAAGLHSLTVHAEPDGKRRPVTCLEKKALFNLLCSTLKI